MRTNPIHPCKMRGARGATRTIKRPRKVTRQLRKMARGRRRAILRATRRKRDQGGKSRSYILLFLLALDSDTRKIFREWSTVCRQRIYLSCICNCMLCWPLVQHWEGHQHCQINGTRWSEQNWRAWGRQDCQAGSDDRLKEEYIQLHSAWRMLNVYNSDDEACQYYLTTYCKILKIAPGLALLIESHCHSTEPANITWKAGFFKVGLTMVMDDRHHQ